MPRNIRWDESVKENALNLVEALLYQADDELDDLALKTAVHVEWVTANKLRVTGKQKQTKRKREQVIEVGTRKEHLIRLVGKAGKSLNLPQPKKESGSSQPERELAEVQTALDCLRELGVFEEEKNTRKNQGYWKFTLTLKYQTATREENLEVVKQKWKEHRKTNSPVTSPTTPILETEKSIDWRDVCRTMLEKQKQLTTNRLMRADEMVFDIDRIRVDLALVERKQTDKRSGDDNPARSQLYKPDYEKTEKLEYKDFLTKVLKSEQSKKIAIIGEPGAGKTTLLQRIAFWILENTDDLPIWIPLGNFPNPAPKFKDYLLNDWLEDAIVSVTPKIKAEFEELLMAGKVWLLLDGVDEMAAKSGSPLTVIANRIVGWCDRLRVVLTCRLNVWEANPYSLNGFQSYRTLEFSEEKVEEFIKACFQNRRGDTCVAPTLGVQLQQALNQPGKERIKDLVRNPLRLTLLCSTWHLREGKLPDTKAELYQQFVEEVYRWQDKEKEVSTITPEEREQLNAKLKELAVAAIDNETNRFCLRHKFVEDVFGDSSLFQLALKVPWLNQVAVDAKNPYQPVYAFFHPTFQEYFAALASDDWDFFLPRAHDNHNPKPVSERYRIFEPQWKEVILLWLGREDVAREQKEEFIWALMNFDDGCKCFYWYRAVFLSAAGIAEFENCKFSNAIVAKLIEWSFDYFNVDTWKGWIRHPIEESARAALHETNLKRVIEGLNKLLYANQNRYKSQELAKKLGKIDPGNPNAVNVLKDLLDTSQRELETLLIAESLWEAAPNNPKPIQTMIGLLQNSKDKIILNQSVDKLEKVGIGNSDAIAALINLLLSCKDELSRRRAFRSLANIAIGNSHAITALISWLDINQDEVINREIVWCLGKISLIKSDVADVLVDLLHTTQDEPTRWRIAESLGTIGINNQKVIDTLVDLVDNSQYDEWTRQQAAESLGKLQPRNTKAIALLIELLHNTQNRRTCKRILKSLEKIGIGNQKAINAISELLDTVQDEWICQQSAESLGTIDPGNPKAINFLIKVLQINQNEPMRREVIWSIGTIGMGNSDALKALTEVLCNTQSEPILQYEPTLWYAARSLQKIFLKSSSSLLVVSGLKEYIQDEVYRNDFERFKHCYEVIWHCAQNMTYPAFYQAWHQQEEAEKTTTPDRQSLNQADLPQSLQSAIANDPQLSQTIHLICIDGSQFIDPDRPAAEIYDQMLDQNCPECDRVPETMPALKLYWKSLKRKSDKQPVLVFYASSTEPYSETFLKDLSKFKGEICVMTSPPAPLLAGEGSKSDSCSPSSLQGEGVRGWGSLQFFAPSQVIADVTKWIRAIAFS
jgi:HEAT repeat protein/GTPase SAR1 family protein